MKQIFRDRLEKLANLLDEVAATDHRNRFTMSRYRSDNAFDRKQKDLHTCGTAGCAIGWAPAIMTNEEFSDCTYSCGNIDFDKVSEHFGFKTLNRSWRFLFDCSWKHIDDTPEGAAARIRYFLDKGLPEIAEENDPDFYGRQALELYKPYLK